MSRRSERQSSTVAESFWCGAFSVERNLPPNMRVIGDSDDLTFVHTRGIRLMIYENETEQDIPNE